MSTGLRLSDGKSALMGSAFMASVSTAAVLTASAQDFAVSYYDLRGVPYTDIIKGMPTPWESAFAGSTRTHYAVDLYEQGFVSRNGAIKTVPVGTTKFWGTEIAYPISYTPTVYNGRTLVLENAEGRFAGSGNSLGMFGMGDAVVAVDDYFETTSTGDGSTTIFKLIGAAGYTADQIKVYVGGHLKANQIAATSGYIVADNAADLDVTFASAPANTASILMAICRREYVIGDASTVRTTGPFPEINTTTAANILDFRFSMYWKDEEAELRDIENNLYKAFSPIIRNWLKPNKYIRMLDLYGPVMVNQASQYSDMSGLDDQTWRASPDKFYADSAWEMKGTGLNASNCTRPLLSLCKSGYAQPRIPWLNIPFFIGSPVEPHSRAYWFSGSGGQGSFGDIYFSTTVDTSTVALSSVTPAATIITMLPNNVGFRVDASALTNSAEAEILVNFTANDSKGVAIPGGFTVPVRAIPVSATAGEYLVRIKGSLWSNNPTLFENHYAWKEWGDGIVADLIAVNFPTTTPVIVEPSNEVWNFSTQRFELSTIFGQDVGDYYGMTTNRLGGHGYIAGKLMKAIEDAQAAAGTSFDIQMMVPGQAANTGVTFDKLFGYKFFWEDATNGQGLSGAALTAKMNAVHTSVANYYSAPFADDAANNITGLSGQPHIDQVLLWLGDGSLWTRTFTWYTQTTNKQFNVQWNIDQMVAHKAIADSFGAKFQIMYEGSSHDDSSVIVSGLRNDATFAAAYDANMNGQLGADIWTDLTNRMRIAIPGIVPSHYGGPYAAGFGQPWAKGWVEQAPIPIMQAINAAGIQ
jgi:hypothetical protein